MFIRVKQDKKANKVFLPLKNKLIGHVFDTEDTMKLFGYLEIDANRIIDGESKHYRIYKDEFDIVDEEEAMKYAFEHVFGVEPEYETKLEDALGRIKHLEQRIKELS